MQLYFGLLNKSEMSFNIFESCYLVARFECVVMYFVIMLALQLAILMTKTFILIFAINSWKFLTASKCRRGYRNRFVVVGTSDGSGQEK